MRRHISFRKAIESICQKYRGKRKDTNVPTGFFSLPIELRLIVYHYLFYSPIEDNISWLFAAPDEELECPTSLLAAFAPLLTCRQFYNEARPIAYALVPVHIRMHTSLASKSLNSTSSRRLFHLSIQERSNLHCITITCSASWGWAIEGYLQVLGRRDVRPKTILIVLRNSDPSQTRNNERKTRRMLKVLSAVLVGLQSVPGAKAIIINVEEGDKVAFKSAFDPAGRHAQTCHGFFVEEWAWRFFKDVHGRERAEITSKLRA